MCELHDTRQVRGRGQSVAGEWQPWGLAVSYRNWPVTARYTDMSEKLQANRNRGVEHQLPVQPRGRECMF